MSEFLIIVSFSMIAGGFIHENNMIISKKLASDPIPKAYFMNVVTSLVCLTTVILIRHNQ